MNRANEWRPRPGTEAAVSESQAELYNRHSTTAPPRMGPFPTEPPSNHQPVAPEPTEPISLAESLARLADILPRLAQVLERAETRSQTQRLALRLDEVAQAIGVSRRALERLLAAGRFPRPDAHAGKCPLWTRPTLERWLAQGGGRI